MYGQKSDLRSKVFINTLCTKSNNSIPQYHQILLSVRTLNYQIIVPPLLPHKVYRFKYYAIFNDDDKNSPTKSNEVYEFFDPTVNLSDSTANYANVCVTYIIL